MKYLISVAFIFTSITQASLKDELFRQVSISHKPLSYHEARSLIFSSVDNNDEEICSVYTPSECKQRAKKQRGFSLNIEHTWPQSKGAKVFPAVSDMHHLFIASKESNSKRANHPFCNIYGIDWEKDESFLGYDRDSETCFEPRDSHKGNVARAMFYFSIRYKKPINEKEEKVFREWNQLDPASASERQRNLQIKLLQGNLNPFVIDSSLVDKILDF